MQSNYDSDNYLTRRTYQGQGKEMRVDYTNNKEDWVGTATRYYDAPVISCPRRAATVPPG